MHIFNYKKHHRNKYIYIYTILMLIKHCYLKRDDEYFVRYNDVNKSKTVPLQLKIENYSFGELFIFAYVDDGGVTADVDIGSNDKNFFRKCREIWNKIIELMDRDNPDDFVNIDDYGEYIMLDTEKYNRFQR